jgi:hypothetical protein
MDQQRIERVVRDISVGREIQDYEALLAVQYAMAQGNIKQVIY